MPRPVARGERDASRKALTSHVFWLLTIPWCLRLLRRSSVLIPRAVQCEDQACDGQNCTETMHVHDAREKFDDEDLNFDLDSVATVWRQSPMPWWWS